MNVDPHGRAGTVLLMLAPAPPAPAETSSGVLPLPSKSTPSSVPIVSALVRMPISELLV